MADDPISASVPDANRPIPPSDQSATSDTNRPVSTNLADSSTPPQSAESASANPDQKSSGDPLQQSSSPNLNNVSTQSDLSQSDNPQPRPKDDQPLADTTHNSFTSPQHDTTDEGGQPPSSISFGDLLPNSSSSTPNLPNETNEPNPPIVATQIQSEPSNNASKSDTDQIASQSAEIKPEPPEVPQPAPSAEPPTSTIASFGDLLNKPTSSDDSSPTTHNPQPTSFGDLLSHEDKPPSPPQALPRTDPTQGESSAGVIEKVIEKPIEVIKEVVREIPVVDQTEITKQVDEKMKAKVVENRLKANRSRVQKRNDHLNQIIELARTKGRLTNQDVRNFLRVSQSTVTDYLHTLVTSRKMKKEGKGKATYYSLS